MELAKEQGIDFVMEKYNLDALLSLGEDGIVDLAAKSGYPVITVPGGFTANGVEKESGFKANGPIGITFTGLAYSEPTLFKIAYGFEQATKHRVSPMLKEDRGENIAG